MAVEVLVTGAAGVLGRALVAALRGSGHNVIACGRTAGPGVDAAWDVARSDAPDIDAAPDVVIHAAAAVGGFGATLEVAGPLFATNVDGTLRVARWCAGRGVRRLIYISGAIVYGAWEEQTKRETDPVEPWKAGAYAVSKYCGETAARLAESNGISVLSMRLSSLWGAGYERGLVGRLLTAGRSLGAITILPPLDDAFDLLHVADAAWTVASAVDVECEGIVNVGSGRLTTLGEIASVCAEAVGAGLRIDEGSADRARRILNWVDDGRARELLGHENRVSLQAGIAGMMEQQNSR